MGDPLDDTRDWSANDIYDLIDDAYSSRARRPSETWFAHTREGYDSEPLPSWIDDLFATSVDVGGMPVD